MFNSLVYPDPPDPLLTEEQSSAFAAVMVVLLKEYRADYTSRQYKKCLRVLRGGRYRTARKCAIRLGVPSDRIDNLLLLIRS